MNNSKKQQNWVIPRNGFETFIKEYRFGFVYIHNKNGTIETALVEFDEELRPIPKRYPIILTDYCLKHKTPPSCLSDKELEYIYSEQYKKDTLRDKKNNLEYYDGDIKNFYLFYLFVIKPTRSILVNYKKDDSVEKDKPHYISFRLHKMSQITNVQRAMLHELASFGLTPLLTAKKDDRLLFMLRTTKELREEIEEARKRTVKTVLKKGNDEK